MSPLNHGFWAAHHFVAGVDEVGRGPLAGPVIAAAVILDKDNKIRGLKDSKAIPEKKRYELAEEIRDKSVAWAIGRAEVAEIDRLNILHASLVAMRRAINALTITPEYILVDGNRCPEVSCSVEAIVKGDQLIPVISAASIIAKVARDNEMLEMENRFPGYGFARHKGYPTRQHIAALDELGPCRIHRRSFAPVKKFLSSSDLI